MEFNVEQLSQIKVLVVGDVMLDQYIWGEVDRISPEAPVPVVTVGKENHVLGGAGNVAANLAGLGTQVCLVGTCGHDENGKTIQSLCAEAGIITRLIIDEQHPTTIKTRVMAKKQQLFRLDREDIQAPSDVLAKEIKAQVQEALISVDVVIFSDYAKGMFLSPELCRDLICLVRKCGIPCLVDPKGKNWERYTGVSFITPNTMELAAVAKLPLEEHGESLISSMTEIRDRYDIQCLLLTRGAKGMCIADKTSPPLFISTAAREVYDVSGAGDTVISTFAATIAMGLAPGDAAGIANIAAGIVVGKVGTQPISISELVPALERLGIHCPGYPQTTADISFDQVIIQVKQWRSCGETVVFTNGCFDLLHPGHIDLLHRSSALGDRLVVGLNSDSSISELKGAGRPIVTENDRANLLNALAAVDAVVIFHESTPLDLLDKLKPDVLVKGADYTLDEIVGKELVESNGGRVARIPLLQGYSTTDIEKRIMGNCSK